MSDAPELLPCPFCGGANVRIYVGLMEFTDGEVTCEDCGGNCGNHPTKAEAITAWNRRADISEAAIAAARAEGERIGMERAAKIAFSYGEKDMLAEHKPYRIAAAIRAAMDAKP